MHDHGRAYLPAAGHNWALPLYDPLVKLLGFDTVMKLLLKQAALQASDRVLDIGCGTGTMAILIKRLHPDTTVRGLDPDPRALKRARHKAERAKLSIPFDQGFGASLPYPDASFDRVFSSFMFHHLRAGERETTLCEVRRVLKSGGSFHLVDFERPDESTGGCLTRLLHSSHHLQDNSDQRILELMNRAGFRDAKKVLTRGLFFGALRIGYFRAAAASSSASFEAHRIPN